MNAFLVAWVVAFASVSQVLFVVEAPAEAPAGTPAQAQAEAQAEANAAPAAVLAQAHWRNIGCCALRAKTTSRGTSTRKTQTHKHTQNANARKTQAEATQTQTFASFSAKGESALIIIFRAAARQ